MQCDLCGSEEQLYKTEIEGTELNVCKKCSSHGKILSVVKEPVPETKKPSFAPEPVAEPEVVESIVPNFAQKIRSKGAWRMNSCSCETCMMACLISFAFTMYTLYDWRFPADGELLAASRIALSFSGSTSFPEYSLDECLFFKTSLNSMGRTGGENNKGV